jgi:hypothetical protein
VIVLTSQLRVYRRTFRGQHACPDENARLAKGRSSVGPPSVRICPHAGEQILTALSGFAYGFVIEAALAGIDTPATAIVPS